LARVVLVRKNQYFDSVFLMAVAGRLAREAGIDDAAAVMGTDANRKTLAEMGFDAGQLASAEPNDLLIALRGEEEAVRRVSSDIGAWLVRKEDAVGAISVPTWDAARKRLPNANLAVISVPGAHAAREAHQALDEGLNVFLFSDHVSIEDELALKQKALGRDLLVMGPDCGTAIIAGKGIGFSNVVRRGPIGVIASSGTGLQEFTCLVHRAGSGISHALGTGSRDLSDAIGGISTLAGLRVLDEDPATLAIAIISKPPGERAMRELVRAADRCAKPVVLCLLGLRQGEVPGLARGRFARTVDDTAALAVELVGGHRAGDVQLSEQTRAALYVEIARVSRGQRFLRGLFAGGTFCYQAQQILRDAGVMAYSNGPISGMLELPDPRISREHSLVDMGADEFTDGKPHPMIDASQRSARILAESQDPSVAVLLLDVILGHNAAVDPAGDIAPAIRRAKRAAEERGGHLIALASVCGTDEDPQGLAGQDGILSDAGALVFGSSLQAVQAASYVVRCLAVQEAP
jgi:FdrA protein